MTGAFVPLRERDAGDAARDGTAAPSEDKAAEQELIVKPDGTPTAKGWRKIGEQFRKEMSAKEREGRGGKKFSYLTVRQVAKRLDDVVGPGNWGTDWECIRADHPVAARVGVSVFGVWKWDVGYSNNPEADAETDRSYELEPLKAAVSDGLKRAAVQWGIGRWLYGDT